MYGRLFWRGMQLVALAAALPAAASWAQTAGPDLRITNCFAPSSASAGESILVTATYRNDGSASSSETVMDVFLRPPPALSKPPLRLTTHPIPPLAPTPVASPDSVAEAPSLIPEAVAPGQYGIEVTLRPFAAGESPSTTQNNSSILAIEVTSSSNTGNTSAAVDLSIVSFAAPGSAFPGDTIQFSVTYTNLGSETSRATTLEVELRDPSNSAFVRKIAQHAVLALAPGASESASGPALIPQDVLPRAYGLRAFIRPAGEPPEHHEDNESVRSFIVEQPTTSSDLPDLQALEVSAGVTPGTTASPTSSGTPPFITASGSVSNGGAGQSPPFKLGFYLSLDENFDAATPGSPGGDPFFGGLQGPSLAPTDIEQFTTSAFAPQNLPPGDYFVLMVADPLGEVPETDESNNGAHSQERFAFEGGSTGRPDLVALGVTADKLELDAGTPLGVTGRFSNSGNHPAGPFNVAFILEPVRLAGSGDTRVSHVLASQRVPGLAAKAELSVTTSGAVPPNARGEYRLQLFVDHGQEIAEPSESNNILSKQENIFVRAPTTGTGPLPDLVITSVSGASFASPGQRYGFGATVKNQGTAGAPAFNVTFGFARSNFISDDGSKPFSRTLAISHLGPLASNQSIDVFVAVTLPNDVVTGTAFVAAAADDQPFQVSESDERNNVALSPSEVTIFSDDTSPGGGGEDLPDLRAGSVGTNAISARPGDLLPYFLAFSNDGFAGVSGLYDVGVVLDSADAAGNFRAFTLAVIRGPSLTSGQRFEKTTSAKIPADVPAGDYLLRLDLDPRQEVDESDEFNNFTHSVHPIRIGLSDPVTTERPDLRFDAVFAPSTGSINSVIQVGAVVRNGGTRSSGEFSVSFNLHQPGGSTTEPGGTPSGFFLHEQRIPGLAPNATADAGGELFVPGFVPAGTYRLSASADPRGEITESNEENNFKTAPDDTTLTGGGTTTDQLPDLVALGISGPTTALVGHPYPVRAEVGNFGHAKSPAFKIDVALSASDFSSAEFDETGGGDEDDSTFIGIGSLFSEGLEANGFRQVSGELLLPPIRSGRYFLAMLADPENRTPELDESNNFAGSAELVNVSASGAAGRVLDLVNESITVPPAGNIGQLVSATVTFRVEGLAAGERLEVPVAISLSGGASGELFVAQTSVPAIAGSSEPFQVTTSVNFRIPFVDLMGLASAPFGVASFLDPQFTIEESHHNNVNQLRATIEVSQGSGGGQRPNVKALSVRMRDSGDQDALGDPPRRRFPGEEVRVIGELAETGGAPVLKPFGVDFFLKYEGTQSLTDPAQPPIPFARAFVEFLDANDNRTLDEPAHLPAFLRPGRYRVGMTADSERFVSESDETDNTALSQGLMVVGTSTATVTDLVALGIIGPSILQIGRTAQVTGQIANRGENPAPGFAVNFVLARNTEFDFNDLLIGSRFVDGLSAGAKITLTPTFEVPLYVAPGNYVLGLIVDAGNFVPETDERNNFVRAAASVQVTTPEIPLKLFDLAAVAVSATPDRVPPGGGLLISGEIENLTTRTVPIPFDYVLFATREAIVAEAGTATALVGEGFEIARNSIPGIGARERRRVEFRGHVPPFVRPGPYFMGLHVDPDARIPESDADRRNNRVLALEPTLVTTPPGQENALDLAATRIFGEATGTAGQEFDLTWALRARNVPKPIAFDVLFLISPEDTSIFATGQGLPFLADGSSPIVLLPIGRQRVSVTATPLTTVASSTTVKLPSELPAGTYRVAMAVDPDGRIPEFDKENNFRRSPNPTLIEGGSAEDDEWRDDPDDTAGSNLPLGLLVDGGPAVDGALQFQSPNDRDQDVFALDVQDGNSYAVEVILGSLFNSQLELLDEEGNRLDFDNNGGAGLASRAEFEATTSGRIFAVVSAPSPFDTGTYRIAARSGAELNRLPDLIAGPLSIRPEIATSSTELNAKFAVGNAGEAAAGPFGWELRVESFIETDEPLLFRPVAEATVIATGTLDGLPPRAFREVPAVGFGPLPNGKYELVLTVDPADDVEETDESNNTNHRPFGVGGVGDDRFRRADLVPAGLFIKPLRPTTTDPVIVAAAVANKGGSPVSTFTVQLFLDRNQAASGTALATYTVEALPPNSVLPLPPTPVGMLAEGQHSLVMIVDPDNRIAEGTETNNQHSQEFFVAPNAGGTFDLLPAHISIFPQAPATGTTVEAGVFVSNRGSEDSPSVLVQFFLDPTRGADGTVTTSPTTSVITEGISARSGRRIGPLEIGTFTEAGGHKLLVRVDSFEPSRPETQTGNNATTTEFSVGSQQVVTQALTFRGIVKDSSGNAVGRGFRVTAVNRSRRILSNVSVTPHTTGTPGSYLTTMGARFSSRPAAAEGDVIAFEVLGPDGERLHVIEPDELVLSRRQVLDGGVLEDITVAPPVVGEIRVEILKPEDSSVFLTDDKIFFRGRATDSQGTELRGRGLVWTIGTDVIGVGPFFATTLPAGNHQVVLTAKDRAGAVATDGIRLMVETGFIDEVNVFGLAGQIFQVGTGNEANSEELELTFTNHTRGLQATARVAAGAGEYSVEFTDESQIVIGAGDQFSVIARDGQSNPVPIAPPRFTVSRRDIAAGQGERSFRVGLEPNRPVELVCGINLISVPLQPFTSDPADRFMALELIEQLGLNYLTRVFAGPDGEPEFVICLRGDGPDFEVQGNESYLGHLTEGRTVEFRGIAWGDDQLDGDLARGLNGLGFPQGVPPNFDVLELIKQSGATFVVRTRVGEGGCGEFQLFTPGLGNEFDFQPGDGLLLGQPLRTPFTFVTE